MKKVEPQNEHEWLKKLVGNWTSEMTAAMGPDQPPETIRGTEAGRAIGDIWVVAEGRSEMPGGGVGTTLFQFGYDVAKQRFVGTFIGSMMTWMWTYDGRLDESGKKLILDTEGPDFAVEGKTSKYQDVIEFVDDDYRTLTSQMPGPDGQWAEFMKIHYRRVK
ncbi:MAG TPA: DUF1579 domain-containing protein [Gemmataceae bacterium]|jgi:hypothetical protein|nr:DUF1579 domain-containing protein [Gemmataceae bacterium]